MPRLERIRESFNENPDVLIKLALYYQDILEFNRRSYKLVKRRAWKFFFMTTWGRFDLRMSAILESLSRRRAEIAEESSTIDMIEARDWRDRPMAKVERQEKDRSEKQRASVVAWLQISSPNQDDELERRLRKCLPGSCEWVIEKLTEWMSPNSSHSFVWIRGKPGAGTVSAVSFLKNKCADYKDT